uniref:ethanolamine kinase n=1 Tax=Sinocyclocheilus grahami TaxID=75366 RepID=A0A672LMD3_SINGR
MSHNYLHCLPYKHLFTDGTTNKLVGCYVEDCLEDVVLVRVYGNKTELIVDRDNELKSFQVLHANGCAPRLYCSFQNGICYEFIQGRALDTQDVRDPVLLRWVRSAQGTKWKDPNGCSF